MRASLLCSLLLLSVSLGAKADTITNFNLSSDFSDGSTAQGLVSIDTTDGQVQNSYIVLSHNGVVDATFTTPDYAQPLYGSYLAEFTDSQSGYKYELLLPDATLADFQGGSVCTLTATCLGGYPSGFYLPDGNGVGAVDGTLAPTPEPASLVFLTTGIALGVLYRRLRPGSSHSGDLARSGALGAQVHPALPHSIP